MIHSSVLNGSRVWKLGMTLIHPLQSVISNGDDKLLFAVIKNEVLAFRKQESSDFSLVGRWVDEVARNKITAEVPGVKKAKSNSGNPKEKVQAENHQGDPTVGVPGTYLRGMTLSSDESKLVICADSDKSVVVLHIDLQKEVSQCLTCIKRQAFPKRPNAIVILEDTQSVVVADKFGDVYEIPLIGGTAVKPGQDLQPLLGHVSMLTDVVFSKDSEGKDFLITSDRDEHIKISHYPQTFIVDKWLFGHHEFVASLHLPQWKLNWLFSAGGDTCVFCWDWEKGTKLATFDYSELIKPYLTDAHLATTRFQNENNDLIEYAVSKVTSCRELPFLAFFVEATRALIILCVCQESGKLSLHQVIDLRYNITSLSQALKGFRVTLDNRESGNKEYVQLIKYVEHQDKFELDDKFSRLFDNAVNESLSNSTIANVELTEIAPLYGVVTLKKHGEQYS